MGPEAAGFEQAPRDVVREVPEAEGRAAEVLEPPVDRLSRAVRGAGAVEVNQNVGGALLERAAKLAQFDEKAWGAVCEGVDELLRDELLELSVGFPVVSDHPWVNTLGRLALGVLPVLELGLLLLLGELPRSGVEGSAGLVGRGVFPPARPECVALDAASALVERITNGAF